MTLGLESVGFELVLANELSPMAGETFAYNLLGKNGENLRKLADKGEQAQKTFWLNSKYNRNELGLRLRENPRLPPAPGEGYNDLDDKDVSLLRGGLLIGDIIALNNYLKKDNQILLEYIRRGFNTTSGVKPGVDLVSGGPPCQSFSLAGLRQHDNERNRLPWEFANFVELVQPRMVVLENVSGILHAFKVNGEKHYAWYEVAKAFVSKGYVPLCLHVNAKYVGAAQNRPRFIMFAMKESVFETFLAHELAQGPNASVDMLKKSRVFYKEVQANPDLAITESHFVYFDVEKDLKLFRDTFLNVFVSHDKTKLHTVDDAIKDLSENLSESHTRTISLSPYVKGINSLLPDRELPTRAYNHEMRRHTLLVRQRFSLYQALSGLSIRARRQTITFLRTGDSRHLSNETINELLGGITVLGPNEAWMEIHNFKDLMAYLHPLKTKKQTQRALVANEPAPAALSIPDDACHYNPGELRSLTVREMARIQSFPDWFEFRSKATTGQQMRKFEVPQYTQVGNAVPPLLGKAIGQIVNHVLQAVDQQPEVYEDFHQLVIQQPSLEEVVN